MGVQAQSVLDGQHSLQQFLDSILIFQDAMDPHILKVF
jgi:hypothetical protein